MILCNYSHRVLHICTGIHDLGPITWELALCLLLAWFCFFLVLLPGIKTFGKVSTNIFPLHNLFLLDLKFKLYLSGVTQGSLFLLLYSPTWSWRSCWFTSNTTRIPRRHHVLTDIAMEQTDRSQCLPGDTATQIFFFQSFLYRPWGGLITLLIWWGGLITLDSVNQLQSIPQLLQVIFDLNGYLSPNQFVIISITI